MKKISSTAPIVGLILCLCTLPPALMVTGCAGDRYHESTGESIDDPAITHRVKNALSQDTQFKYEGVNVDTFKGTVQLSGFVDNSDQKARAGDLAKQVEGVKDVKNNITVKP